MSFIELYNIIKEDFYTSLVNSTKLSLNDDLINKFDKEITKIVKELLDLENKTICSENIKTTYAIRKYYGLYDNGVIQSYKDVGESINVSTGRASQYINRSKKLIKYKILYPEHYKSNSNYVGPISSLKCSSNYKEFNNKDIDDLNISISQYNNLKRLNINTIEDLLCFSLSDLKRMNLTINTINRIESDINDLGLKFFDWLTIEEKISLLEQYSLDDIGSSSSGLLDNNYKLDKYRYSRKYNVNLSTINSVVDFINNSNDLIDNDLINELESLGFSISIDKILEHVLVGKDNLDEKINAISKLNLDIDTLKKLDAHYLGIRYLFYKGKAYKTLGDFIEFDKFELKNFKGIGIKLYEDIIRSIHNLGLYFNDEVNLLKEYCNCIIDLDNKKR